MLAGTIPSLGLSAAGGAAAGYQIARSLRFRGPAVDTQLDRTFVTPTSRQKMTLSCWLKGVNDAYIFDCSQSGSQGSCALRITSSTVYLFEYYSSTYYANPQTTSVYRDPSAWAHYFISIDTTQAVSTDRVKIFINGVQAPTTGAGYPSLNYQFAIINWTYPNCIGRPYYVAGSNFTGYMAEVHWLDGKAAAPTEFGEIDPITGVWRPIKYVGGNYGNNGYYLDFSDNSSVAALGLDRSGRGNNWVPHNFSVTAGITNDSLVDAPTNYGIDTGVGGEVRGNYATLNPLDKDRAHGVLANGNLDYNCLYSDNSAPIRGTIGISSGKFGFEAQLNSTSGIGNSVGFGWTKDTSDLTGKGLLPANITIVGAWFSLNSTIQKISDATTGTAITGSVWSFGDTFQILIDVTAGKYWIGKSGLYCDASGSIPFKVFNESSPTGTFTPGATYYPYAEPVISGDNGNQSTIRVNFGQRAFVSPLPSGFKALCTQNLPDPVIKNPAKYFDINLRAGTAATFSVTGKGFQPDVVWVKGRNNTTNHSLFDSARGPQIEMIPNSSTSEAVQPQGVLSFNADGFSGGSYAPINTSAINNVDWLWKKGMLPGMDIVLDTGTGAQHTIPHSLGVKPDFILRKNRTTSGSTDGWPVYNSLFGYNRPMYLMATYAAALNDPGPWGAEPTSTNFSVGTWGGANNNGTTFVTYLFASVPGFSKVGTYIGNGSADGSFVFCGFKPRWIMVKRNDIANDWDVVDTARMPFNGTFAAIYADLAVIESTGSDGAFDILSNGFKLRGSANSNNASGGTYLYIAFAETPFKYARAR